MSEESGKRVSYVELYLDLVFVLAVGRLAHLIVAHPDKSHVSIAFGLFLTLWWTWIGFAVLYNRHGADSPRQRLLFLAGSIPAGVAAVAIDPAAEGNSTVFVLSLAATRLLLSGANLATGKDLISRRISVSYLISAALLVLSLAVEGPARYVLWGVAIIGVESGALLHDDHKVTREAREQRDFSRYKPENPGEALDAHHFAERFSLFLIILLGEVVVEAGETSVDTIAAGGWLAVVAAMVFAAALWWLYFNAAAEINLKVLQLSGGSPTIARSIFAVGHIFPAFALLVMAAGVGLLLEPHPPGLAYTLPATGLAVYLLSTRVFLFGHDRRNVAIRILLVVLTFKFGQLHHLLGPHGYLWALAAWATICATLSVDGSKFDEDPPPDPVPGQQAPAG